MGTSIHAALGRLACVGLLLAARPAAAQSGDKAVAEALFQKGRNAMASADYATACASFEESNRLDPAPGTMVNLAGCEEQRGHLAAAWSWFAQAGARLAADDPRRQSVLDQAGALKARLPSLTIRLAPEAPPDSKVVRDSVELRAVTLGMALPIDPGTHRVVVSAPGRAERLYDVVLQEKEQGELVVAPGPPLRQAGPVAPDESSGPPWGRDTRTLGYVVGGVGLAGIGTALIFGGLVLGKKGTVEDHCTTNPRGCDQEGLDAVSAGRTFSTVSTVSFVVGALATGAGAYFILTSKDEPETSVGAAALPGGGAIRISRELW